jgi:hypothetical protein
MSMLVNPVTTSLMETQLNHVMYMIRGGARITTATPPDRIMDYTWRDFFMPMAGFAFMAELTFRLVEQAYVVPNFIKLLHMDRLSDLYHWKDGHENIHIPQFAKNLPIQNHPKELPFIIRENMLGEIINPKNYYLVPRTIESEIEDDRSASLAVKSQTRLWAHHLRRILNPEEYINQYLLAENKIGEAEAQALKTQLNQMETLVSQHKAALKDPKAALKFRETLREIVWKKDSTIALGCEDHLLSVLSDPKHFQENLRGPSILKSLGNAFKIGFKNAFNNYKKETFLTSTADFMETFGKQVLTPLTNLEHAANPKLAALSKDLTEGFTTALKLQKVFEGSAFWLKLPLSFVTVAGAWAIANHIDFHYIQPYQRELVKKRGTAREFLGPAFLGWIPATAVFIGLIKQPFIKNLGHVSSFALSGALGLATYLATSIGLFLYKISKPPASPTKGFTPPLNNPLNLTRTHTAPKVGYDYPLPSKAGEGILRPNPPSPFLNAPVNPYVPAYGNPYWNYSAMYGQPQAFNGWYPQSGQN